MNIDTILNPRITTPAQAKLAEHVKDLMVTQCG
jgi:hypothetical protein